MKYLATKLFNYLSVLLLFIASINSYANNIPEDKAKLVATNYLRHLTNQPLKRSGDLVKLVYTPTKSSNKRGVSSPSFYIFNQIEGTGFIIVSGNDNIKPILGYSLESNFDETNISPQVAYWLSEYEKQISFVVDAKIENIVEKQEWEQISNNIISRKRGTTAVKPLLKTIWNQSPYYNDQCPLDNGVRTVTGCVATAMAQTMKYWNFPITGTGSNSYTAGNYGVQSANFGSTTYDWSNMPNNVNSPNSEVAKLMYHIGVAIQMKYGLASTGGSSAFITYDTYYSPYPNGHLALKNYFKYDANSIQSIYKKNYTDQTWIDKIKSELIESRVVIFEGSASDGKGGHCFVADGFDQNNFIHFNWGWGGSYNGYFSITSLIPSGTGTGGGAGDYTYNQGAVIGIKPPTTNIPKADFSASSLITSAGGVITLTDESTNYPNSWSWTISPNNATFVNGTSNTSKFPEISFSTPGKYTITLISTNSMGSNTVSKTNYITVNPALDKQVCDTLTNFLPTEKKNYIFIIGGGSLAGHVKNLNGFAEQYSIPTGYTHVSGALLDFARAETNSNTSTIKVNVYQNNNGAPGSIITSKNVKILDIKNDVVNGLQTKVIFDSPVAVSGLFYIGFETTNAPGDTVGLYTSSTSGVTTNTGFIKYISNNSWCSYSNCWGGLKIHLKASPLVSILPTPNFVINSTPAIVNSSVVIDASTSINAYAYNWTINGSSITTSNFYKETISYPSAGTFDIKLDAIGGCGNVSSITKQISVSSSCSVAPNSPGQITGLNKICVEQKNVTYSVEPVVGATSYAWSLPNGFTGISTSNTIIVSASSNQTTGNIQVAAVNTCGTSPQSVLSVSTISLPDPGTLQNINDICLGKSLNISSSKTGGIWNSSDNNVATIDQTGLIKSVSKGSTTITYIVTINNCSNSVSKQIKVNNCASLDNQSEFFVKVYPNPCQDVLNIIQESNIYSYYRILDVVGKIIDEGKFVDSESVLKTNQLVSGQYILRLESNDGEFKHVNFNKN